MCPLNVTGLSGFSEIGGKHLQLLQELSPGKQVVAVLMNPETPFTRLALKQIEIAAQANRTRLEILETRTADVRLPAVYPSTEWAEAGGLMSYGADRRQMSGERPST